VQVFSAQSDVDGDELQSSLSVSATVEFDTVIQGTDGQSPLLSLIAAGPSKCKATWATPPGAVAFPSGLLISRLKRFGIRARRVAVGKDLSG